jgi:hypothetical protein
MMKRRVFELGLACALGLGPLLLSIASSPSRAQTPQAATSAPARSQIDVLVDDITTHKQMCEKTHSSKDALYRQCANEHKALVDRQRRLGVSNGALNESLKPRGLRWP